MAEVNANDKRIKGVIIEAAGDVKQNGIIRTDKYALVGIRTLGKYESNTGQIIQGEQRKEKWWERTWVQTTALIGAFASIIGLILYIFSK